MHIKCKVCGGVLILEYDIVLHRDKILCLNCGRPYGMPPLEVAEKRRTQPVSMLKGRRF